LYPASGDSDDYMYKVDVGVNQKDTIFAHTPEVGTAFWQPSSEIIATCQEMAFPNLILAHLTRNYSIVKDTDPSSVATISGNFNHSIKRLGRQSGPVVVSIQPLLNIVSVGNSVSYNLNSQQTSTGAISYSLNPSIQFGDQIKYILKTDNGLWVKKDTIVKTFGAITLQALEDASSVTNWTGTWSTTTSTFVSPSKSFFDGSTSNYSNNTNKTYTYVPTIDLTQATSAMISFYAKWGIEADYDFVQFQVSTDGGTTWIGQCGNYTVSGTSANGSVQPNGQPVYEGTQSSWVLEEINLSDYLGQQIKVRFQLRSDGGTTADGYYFDDFKVFYSVPSNNPPTASFTSPNALCQGSTVTFTDFSTNSPTTWAWNFGDGNTSTQQNPTHTYAAAGSYTVSLTVSNSAGTNSTTQNIVVNAVPIVTLTSSDADNVVCSNEGLVQLTPTPSNAILTGTGVANSTFNPSMANVGVNTITANYTDANGCQGSALLSIIVEQCASVLENPTHVIQIFPNPSEGELSINGFKGIANVQIKDFNGKVVYRNVEFHAQDKINLSDYANGAYLVEIEGENQERISKKLFLIK
ncbi:MAG: PKD domain-containing protein, partial [Bacteroidota bacterium]